MPVGVGVDCKTAFPSSSSSLTGTSTTAWTRRTTRGKVSALVGEWSLSARVVDEDADADAQRFVADEVAEESTARIGTCFGVRAVSVVCWVGGNDVG